MKRDLSLKAETLSRFLLFYLLLVFSDAFELSLKRKTIEKLHFEHNFFTNLQYYKYIPITTNFFIFSFLPYTPPKYQVLLL